MRCEVLKATSVKTAVWNIPPSALVMEVIRVSETSINFKITRLYNTKCCRCRGLWKQNLQIYQRFFMDYVRSEDQFWTCFTVAPTRLVCLNDAAVLRCLSSTQRTLDFHWWRISHSDLSKLHFQRDVLESALLSSFSDLLPRFCPLSSAVQLKLFIGQAHSFFEEWAPFGAYLIATLILVRN